MSVDSSHAHSDQIHSHERIHEQHEINGPKGIKGPIGYICDHKYCKVFSCSSKHENYYDEHREGLFLVTIDDKKYYTSSRGYEIKNKHEPCDI